MFGSSIYGAKAYAQVGAETNITGASPHKLVVLLFDGAIVAVENAIKHMTAGSVAEKGDSINKAIMIVDGGLRASLNKQAGGEIANTLDKLYEYIGYRLLVANLRNDKTVLSEALVLLQDLRNSWAEINPEKSFSSEVPFFPAGATTAAAGYKSKLIAA